MKILLNPDTNKVAEIRQALKENELFRICNKCKNL